MHYYDADPLYPTIQYAWLWKVRRWCAIVAGLAIVAEAESAEAIVIKAQNWAEAHL